MRLFVVCFLLMNASISFGYVSEKETQNIQAANYKIDRVLKGYTDELETSLSYSIQHLGERDTWLDSGAGDALALVGYLTHGGKASVVAIDARATTNKTTQKALLKYRHRFKYLSGKYLEDMNQNDFPKARLITDVLGSLAYTANIDVVADRLLNALSLNGRLYFQIDEGTIPTQIPSDVENANNVLYVIENGKKRLAPMADWYSAISGVSFHAGRSGDGGHESGYFERTKDVIVVPRLEIQSYKQDTPPQRVFVWRKN